MAEYIDKTVLVKRLEGRVKDYGRDCNSNAPIISRTYQAVLHMIENLPTADVVPVVRCGECVHSKKLDKHCELNTDYYLHCKLYRGEEEKNVWHKYKKYFADYSLVAIDDYCSYGERRCFDG